MVERWTRDRKAAFRDPAGAAGEKKNSTFCADSYVSIRSIPVLPHVKDSGHSVKDAGGRLQLNTHDKSEQKRIK